MRNDSSVVGIRRRCRNNYQIKFVYRVNCSKYTHCSQLFAYPLVCVAGTTRGTYICTQMNTKIANETVEFPRVSKPALLVSGSHSHWPMSWLYREPLQLKLMNPNHYIRLLLRLHSTSVPAAPMSAASTCVIWSSGDVQNAALLHVSTTQFSEILLIVSSINSDVMTFLL